jgi:hypothetical protein
MSFFAQSSRFLTVSGANVRSCDFWKRCELPSSKRLRLPALLQRGLAWAVAHFLPSAAARSSLAPVAEIAFCPRGRNRNPTPDPKESNRLARRG